MTVKSFAQLVPDKLVLWGPSAAAEQGLVGMVAQVGDLREASLLP